MADYHPDDLVTCPYCLPPKTHQIRYKRLNIHLTEMKKQDPSLARLKRCKYNALHVLHESKIAEHEFSCPDGVTSQEVASDGKEFQHKFEDIVHHNVPIEESWEDTSEQPMYFRLHNDPARPLLSRTNEPTGTANTVDDKNYVPVGMNITQKQNHKKNEAIQKNVRKVTETKAFNAKHLNINVN